MKPDLHEMLESFRTEDEAASVRSMVDRFLLLSPPQQSELLAYFVFALMERWELEVETDQDMRRKIAQAVALMQAEHEPRQ